MATAYLTSAPDSTDNSPALTPADVAAHLAASYVRTAPGESDPNPDEALRRARGLAAAGSVR
ncbi:hypothetical protein OHR86_28040 [Streptomyces sp. NBC_00441]|uniref:hypothetical protein n=1 Tax=Streptomyces sp. NBC_00441 TaxID=2975742 RepID=UPI002E2DCC3A|nr:hypothetical protein [Streptomyces sp. NBC_00441]